MDRAAEERKWDEFVTLYVQLEDGKAYTTLAGFEKLSDYSCTVPSGQVIGKVWKRGEPYSGPRTWWLGQYTKSDDPEYINIVWRELWLLDHAFGEEPKRATDEAVETLKTACLAARTMDAR